MRILIVCTGNICRSPVAERLLQRHLDQHDINAQVRSAGTSARNRSPNPDTVAAAALVGIDLADHRPRRIDPAMIATEGADLILAMTRSHVRDLIGVTPDAWDHLYTLREFARLAPGPARDRDRLKLLVDDPSDDVADPYGRPAAHHQLMVHDVDNLCRRVADSLAMSR